MNSTVKKVSLISIMCFTSGFALNLHAADQSETIKADCSKKATEKTGYDPAKASSSGNTAAKGAGAGALGGTAVRAAQGKDNLAKGAVIGGVVGGGLGARKSKKGQEKAAASQAAYQTEYDSCLKNNDSEPVNVK